MDAELLSRFQFAFTIAFHIIFPSLTIGLASYLAVLEGLWLLSGHEIYMAVYRYWLKIFALSFGMGVVSGIVMSYQIGTNWGPFADMTGPVLGPLLGYEVLTAFFLEAGFLGVMLFGMKRVGKQLHFLATLLVAVGTLISTFWILSANSWMQTPAGYVVANGQFVPNDWWAVIFNPSFPYRLMHMVLAAYLTTAFVVGAVGAYHLLRDRANAPGAVMFSMAMWMATIVAPLQIVVGDFHGLNTLEHQPAKIAALEGHWETQRGAPLILFGMPNQKEERTDYEIAIPKLGSLILTHDPDGEVRGLKSWPRDERPPSAVIFWSFRIMVGIGFAMALTGILSFYLRLRGRLATPWLLRLAILLGPMGFVAVIAGWITTEVGRQPYLVYGLLRVAEGRSHVDAPAVAGSLLSFIVVYCAVFGAGIYYILRLMAQPPDSGDTEIDPNQPHRASHPLAPIAARQTPTAGER